MRYYTIDDVSKMLGLTRLEVMKLTSRKELRYYRVFYETTDPSGIMHRRSRYRFSKKQLSRLLENHPEYLKRYQEYMSKH